MSENERRRSENKANGQHNLKGCWIRRGRHWNALSAWAGFSVSTRNQGPITPAWGEWQVGKKKKRKKMIVFSFFCAIKQEVWNRIVFVRSILSLLSARVSKQTQSGPPTQKNGPVAQRPAALHLRNSLKENRKEKRRKMERITKSCDGSVVQLDDVSQSGHGPAGKNDDRIIYRRETWKRRAAAGATDIPRLSTPLMTN